MTWLSEWYQISQRLGRDLDLFLGLSPCREFREKNQNGIFFFACCFFFLFLCFSKDHQMRMWNYTCSSWIQSPHLGLPDQREILICFVWHLKHIEPLFNLFNFKTFQSVLNREWEIMLEFRSDIPEKLRDRSHPGRIGNYGRWNIFRTYLF